MNEKLLYEILSEVKGLKKSQEDLRHELKSDIKVVETNLRQEMKELDAKIDHTNRRIDQLEVKIDDIQAAVHRLESNPPEDIIALLKQMNQKLDQRIALLEQRQDNLVVRFSYVEAKHDLEIRDIQKEIDHVKETKEKL